MTKTQQYSLKSLTCVISCIAVLIGVTVWYFDIPHAPVENVPALHGKTDLETFNLLGQPDSEYSFTMDQSVGELRVELYNTYPPSSPNNPNVEIRECTWEYSRHRLVVWFHKPDDKWIALDTCRYRNGIVF
ncbi:MAG: hypothetical protein COA78_35410 [Blastopirellula sp.]|nr:MAG: hypothetical protein COA78_35410 [Blastopirellula sp.]